MTKEAANAPEPVEINGVQCFVYPAEQYAAIDADVAAERKGETVSAGAVARQMATWAGIREALNLKWMLEEMLADANRASFRHGQTEATLKSLLFALHARPYHGHPLLTVEEAIESANKLLDEKHLV